MGISSINTLPSTHVHQLNEPPLSKEGTYNVHRDTSHVEHTMRCDSDVNVLFFINAISHWEKSNDPGQELPWRKQVVSREQDRNNKRRPITEPAYPRHKKSSEIKLFSNRPQNSICGNIQCQSDRNDPTRVVCIIAEKVCYFKILRYSAE